MIKREAEDRHGEKSYFGHPLAETPRKGRYALVLLGICAVAFAGVTLTLVMTGRSLVWDTDGRLLYFPFMVAEGEWLRDIAASLLAGDLTIPLYSFDIGFGADWLITASGNSNEPINLLASLCPPEASEWLYDALVFLRFYLAALTFSFYCFSRGKGKRATLVGALCYVLCGYVLFWGVLRHPNFIDFAILLPLVFMGSDKLFVGKNPLLFIVSMAGIFVYSIYFAYMMCLFLLVYCLITYFAYPRERSVGDFALLVGKFVLCLLVAFALVGFSTIPMFITLTSMGRVGIVRDIPFFQTADFYESFASVLLGNHEAQNASVLGAIPVIAILALVAARGSMDERDRRAWGCGIALCLAGALIAKVGSVFNGFGYPTDRWEVILGVRGGAPGACDSSFFGAPMEATYRTCRLSGCLGLGLCVQRGDVVRVCCGGHVCWHLRSIGALGLFPSARCGFLLVGSASRFDESLLVRSARSCRCGQCYGSCRPFHESARQFLLQGIYSNGSCVGYARTAGPLPGPRPT